jgi:hypothetical protein
MAPYGSCATSQPDYPQTPAISIAGIIRKLSGQSK